MKTSTLLTKAMNLVGEPERGTKGALARDKEGLPVPPYDIKARSYCAYGAVEKFRRPISERHSATVYLVFAACEVLTPEQRLIYNVPALNDDKDTTHMDILLLYAIAIDLAKQDGD